MLKCKGYLGRVFTIGILCWVVLTIRILLHRLPADRLTEAMVNMNELSTLVRNRSTISAPTLASPSKAAKAAVLLMGCNRPEAVKRSLTQLLRHRPLGWETAYPVLVSLDCQHRLTQAAVGEFSGRLAHRLVQPDQGVIPVGPRERRFLGYYRIARHFRWAMDQVFLRLNYTAAIIVEDDLDIAPDFYRYFDHLAPLLHMDPTIWCISAWNDNGKADLIEANRSDLFYRTEFFPGLGWMLLGSTWRQLRPDWPPAYWDDHLRKAEIRDGRSCIRPEVSRTYTFGKVGVSHGQHFDTFLRFIHLHGGRANYSGQPLTHLLKANYDAGFTAAVYRLPLAPSLKAALTQVPKPGNGVRVEYSTKDGFLSMAKQLGAMADFKHGVPRCAYDGIVPLYKHGRRIFLAPRLPWKGYNVTWKS